MKNMKNMSITNDANDTEIMIFDFQWPANIMLSKDNEIAWKHSHNHLISIQ